MTTAEETDNPAARLGLQSGQVVLEIGGDQDSDQELRTGIVSVTGQELVDDDHADGADVVLLWFRDQDGDLGEALVDAAVYLVEGGQIWLLTPKTGRDGYIEASDIGEAATSMGLARHGSASVCTDWTGTRLTQPRTRSSVR
ncbi:DUF3052 domain-containing protein [Nocardiopsis sp. CT-R113]|uniref:DUF3052 domain-containing protein n=1 Tax=Nocardiopsis codii TaxID=3065942 RepID=A0ABU7KFW6_9ACTN|nr:DUF3052 domain-containing protein [Nocardiopsis sp. CT-R113]MEE2040897.1 DUF3052 domain-containing protein [Nocardiopsis sp. CT-R113]